QRTVIAVVLILHAAIGRLRPAIGAHDAGGERADIARNRLSRLGGDEIKVGARPQRTALDRGDEATQTTAIVDSADLVDVAVRDGGDLLGDQTAGVPGKIAEQRRREQREQKQIDQRQTERRRSDQLTECRHESCTPRREWYGAAAARNPCRSWS